MQSINITSPVEILWHQYCPDVLLTELKWLKRCPRHFLKDALAIAQKQDKAGRFKSRNQAKQDLADALRVLAVARG